MRSMTLNEIRRAIGGRWAGANTPEDAVCHGVSNDTRTLQAGDLYVALRGERFDGHDFLVQAFEKQAVCALIDASQAARVPPGMPAIAITDTHRSLRRLARHYRRSMAGTGVVGVAGSNGKTTTREMIAAILATAGPVVRNEANHNNFIGVPQTLFRIERDTRYAVVEIGTNRPGEVKELTSIVEPNVGVLTSIGEEHLEGLGGIEGVIEEEGSLLAGLGPRAVAIVNYDDRNCLRARDRMRGRVIGYGFDSRCEIRAGDVVVDTNGTSFRLNERHAFRLPLFGRHNVSNALAAIAAGWVNGIPVDAMQRALAAFKPVDMRLQLRELRGVFVFNDSYNANPPSMRAALRTLSEFRTRHRRIAVLGDMLELGAQAEKAHERLAWVIRTRQVDLAVCVGPLMRGLGADVERQLGIPVWYFDDAYAAGLALAEELKAGDVALVKGSRGMRMERAIEALEEVWLGVKTAPGDGARH